MYFPHRQYAKCYHVHPTQTIRKIAIMYIPHRQYAKCYHVHPTQTIRKIAIMYIPPRQYEKCYHVLPTQTIHKIVIMYFPHRQSQIYCLTRSWLRTLMSLVVFTCICRCTICNNSLAVLFGQTSQIRPVKPHKHWF